MASVSQRQEVLDLLENILKDPEKYGDQFLIKIVHTSKDGMVAISSLYNMASVLNKYPIKYIRHCIPLDIKGRFRLNYLHDKVGLISHALNFETDQYGFIRHVEDSNQDNENNEQEGLMEEGEISDENDVDAVNDSKDTNKSSIYNHMLDIGDLSLKRNAVMPVIFSNGRFFIDNEPIKQREDVKFYYDLLDIQPLGLEYHIDPAGSCFNCGGDHKIGVCPEPINRTKVEKNKKKFRTDNNLLPTGGRLYEELERQDRIKDLAPGVLSDTLKEALGMKPDDVQPPYYKNMRRHGYPPGYMGKDGYQIPHGTKLTLDDIVNSKAPLIRIYDDYVEKDEEGEVSNSSDDLEDGGRPRRFQLVYYPDLNLSDTSKRDRYIDYDAPPPTTDDYNQAYQAQQYWDYYYYAQQQQQQQQPSYLYYNLGQFDYSPHSLPLQQANPSMQQVDFAPGTEQNATSENPQWAYMQQMEYPPTTSINPPPSLSSPPLFPPPARPIVTYNDLDDDDQSVDMDISSDDEG